MANLQSFFVNVVILLLVTRDLRSVLLDQFPLQKGYTGLTVIPVYPSSNLCINVTRVGHTQAHQHITNVP